ncbi:MAG: hypothetical protein NT130_04515 [Candidatus Micrarchaeota archaeon]|nr:hypothetical protein [Candidatus Micrarchaeota archaeon]
MFEICTLYMDPTYKSGKLRLKKEALKALGVRSKSGKVVVLAEIRGRLVILKCSEPIRHDDIA